MTPRQVAVNALLANKPERVGRIVLAGICGSDAHGTKLPTGHKFATDDIDTFGVSVQPEEWYLGLDGYSGNLRRLTWETGGDDNDHCVHDVRKFFALLSKGNPNVHNWLWADPEDIVHTTMAGRLILLNRALFLSRHCFAALAGYAHAQLHKMDRKRYAGYMGEKRRVIVDEVGYDVKHAAHCIRLLKMGIELARERTLMTRRPTEEATMLKEIKAGDWPYRRTRAYADDLFCRFRDAEKLSDLPDDVDYSRINALLVQVIRLSNCEVA